MFAQAVATLVVGLAAGAPIVFHDVTVIDVAAPSANEARLAGRTVVVHGDSIRSVEAGAAVPEDAVVAGTGGYLVPGFWDLHVHLNRDVETAERVMMPLFVANGVTGVRDMQSDCGEPCEPNKQTLATMRALAERAETGEVLGPRVLALSSAIVWPARAPPESAGTTRYLPRTEAEGRALARALAADGVDLIKTYHAVPRAAFHGLANEAAELGVPVAGHMPWSVTPEEASVWGLRSIEHARWPALACNDAYEPFRAAYDAYTAGTIDTFPQLEFETLRQSAVAGFDEARCRALLETLAKNGTALVPTHLTREMDARAHEASYRDDPRRRYVPRARLRGWDRDLDGTAEATEELRSFYRDFFTLGLRVTGLAHEVGVTVLAGTDAFDTMVFPGFSVHDEFLHLARAGLTPIEVLRAATLAPARFLGRDARHGTIEPGKAGDLVWLDGDPLDDLHATSAIRGVVLRGRYFSRAALDSMLAGVDALVNPPVLDLPVPGDAAARYGGAFVGADADTLVVRVHEGRILLDAWGQHSLALLHQGGDAFRFQAEPRAEAVFRMAGGRAISIVVRNGTAEMVYER